VDKGELSGWRMKWRMKRGMGGLTSNEEGDSLGWVVGGEQQQ
jgi:hypothetical protein